MGAVWCNFDKGEMVGDRRVCSVMTNVDEGEMVEGWGLCGVILMRERWWRDERVGGVWCKCMRERCFMRMTECYSVFDS